MEVELSQPHITYLSLGSNEGDRFENLQLAVYEIHKNAGKITAISSIYENPPIGFESELQFYNLCLELETYHTPQVLLKHLKTIEVSMGRKKVNSNTYSSRIIDIDIILFSNTVLQTTELIIPHKFYQDRKFVLQPLLEINNTLVDPITKLTISQLNINCSDKSPLKLVEKQILVFE
jgi:deoxyguanosine kinase